MLRESHRLGIEPATCKLQVQRPTAEPPRNCHRAKNNYTFGMPDPTLSIHYTTFIYGAAMTIKGR